MTDANYNKRQLLQSPQTLATVAGSILVKQYGEDIYDWDPLTVFLEVKDDFKIDINESVLDRWSALQVVMTTDSFFKRLDAFLSVCNTFSTGQPFFNIFDPATLEEVAWGVVEVSLNRELLPFSRAIKDYIHILFKSDGYSEDEYPDVFKEVFEKTPKAIDIRSGLGALNNSNKLEQYVNEQLKDLVYQFNSVDDLKHIDNIILQRNLNEFAKNVIKKGG